MVGTTYGQWIYRNMLVHNTVSGLKAEEKKEELQREIEDQIELGGSGLDEQDRYLLENNLEYLKTSTGEYQYYWRIAIRAARADWILRRRQQESVTGELLGGRHKEGRSRGTDHDPTSLEHRKGEDWITVDVVLNFDI